MFYKFEPFFGTERRPLALRLPLSLSPKRTQVCLTAFREGDQDAFTRIYTRFHKPILRHVRTKIRDEEVANELTQEIFLKAFRFRESFQEKYAFSTWLWTIARNTVSDHLRSSRTDPGGATVPDGEDPVSPEDLPSPQKCPEAHALKKDERRAFVRLFRGLTRAQRRVLRLRLVHQLSYPEISRRLGLSLTAVKNLAYRAKLALVPVGDLPIADL